MASLMVGGCSTVRVTDPPRTATEQFLLSEAAARAIDQLPVDALEDREVYVDDAFLERIDEPYVTARLRAHLLEQGVRLVNERSEAQIILEARSRGVGIDHYEYLLGLPPVLLPASVADTGSDIEGGTLVTPEIALVKNTRQRGFASVAFAAYWADTGERVAASGPTVGRTFREDWWFFGLGPQTSGNIPPVDPGP